MLVVCGQQLEEGELKIQFALNNIGENGDSNKHQYEAHADGDILVLMDISRDASMVAEGVAREVINRIQRMRKKANLVPTDVISVFYSVSGSEYVSQTVSSFTDYISTALKAPFAPLPVKDGKKVIIEETYDLQELKLEGEDTKKAQLEIVITT